MFVEQEQEEPSILKILLDISYYTTYIVLAGFCFYKENICLIYVFCKYLLSRISQVVQRN